MGLLEDYVNQIIVCEESEQREILQQILATFSRYPMPRFTLDSFWLLNDVRQQGYATPEQWVELLALGLKFHQGDEDLEKIFGSFRWGRDSK